MAGFADYLENLLLDAYFGATTVGPATLYVGLSTTAPTDAGGNITEPAGNNYARVAKTNNATNFPAASAGAKSNGTEVNFPTPSGSWGTVTHWFISDAASGGNVSVSAPLDVANPIVSGNIVKFPVGDLDITLD